MVQATPDGLILEQIQPLTLAMVGSAERGWDDHGGSAKRRDPPRSNWWRSMLYSDRPFPSAA